MIETDWHVGRILDLLDSQQLSEDTLVLFTSDNGPETTWKERAKRFAHQSNAIYREGKRSIYEGGHRVPFFVRWPAKIDPASKYSGPVCQTDVLATLAELLGKKLPENAGEDSVSFFAGLINADASANRPPMIHHSAQGGFAIRDGRWKLVMEGNRQKRELYDLDADPSETQRIADGKARLTKALSKTRALIGKLAGEELDLADMVGGGDGRGSGIKGSGIHIRTGNFVTKKYSYHRDIKTNRLQKLELPGAPKDTLRLVKYVFVPDGRNPVPVDYKKEVTDLPATSGHTWDAIRNGSLNAQRTTKLNGTDFATAGHSILGLHANSGITFDLGKIRQRDEA